MAAAVTWTNPAGLLVLLLLAPLVALYVVRAKRTRTVVSSVWLFREARRDLTAARKLRRLVPVTPLFIEAVAVAALALAAAGPARLGALRSADAVAIVLDVSASMGASDGGVTRLVRAKDAIERLLSGLSGHDVLVVEAGKEPRAATGVEHDPDRLARVVDAASVRAESGDLGAAVLLAEERLSTLPGAHRVIVVTDVNGSVPARTRVPLEVVRVGTVADNAALTRFELKRTNGPSARGDRVDALVVVRSFAERETERFVSLSRRGAGAPFASRRVVLAPRGRATVTLSFDVTDDDTGTGIVADLSPGDALAVDDAAFAAVPPGPRLPVVVAARDDDPWLTRALSADDGVALSRAPLPLPPHTVPRGALLVAIGACADSNGDVLIVDPPSGDCLGVHVGAEAAAKGVTWWSERDARLRFVSLDDVYVPKARPLDAGREGSLVRAGGATIIADLGLASGRTGTLVGFDWGQSDWPLRASFVLFVRNITEMARADRALAFSGGAHAGETLRVPAVASGSAFTVRGPSGELSARVAGTTLLAAAPPLPGFYDVLADGRVARTIAVNIDDFRESDLRAIPDDVPATATNVEGSPSRAASSLAPLLAVLALGAVVAESWWLSRRASSRGLAKGGAAIAVCLAVSAAIAVYALGPIPRQKNAQVTFEGPVWLLCGTGALALALLCARRGPRALRVEAFLGTAAVAATLVAAGAAIRMGFDRLAIVIAVDRSRSVDLVPDATTHVDAAITAAGKGMKPRDEIAVVAFAADTALEEPWRTASEPRSPQRAALSRDGTDLSAAVRRALAETPPDCAARIVLVTDGVATRGDTEAAAAAAALAGVPVDVLPLVQVPRSNVRVEALHAPARASVGESLDLRVTVRSTAETTASLVVLVDGQERQRGKVVLHEGEDALYVRAQASEAGLHRYAVRIAPDDPATDAVTEDDSGTTFVRVAGRPRAVVIAADPAHAQAIRGALEAAAFDVDVTTPTRGPADASELLSSDLVVLGDVPARDFSGDQLEQLASYVEHLGGGLLLFGGKRAMGPGGYAGTPVEKVSPVSFELRNERRRARLAEVIAIDYSGSMAVNAGSHTKLELANEAAVRSAELLGSLDRLGVLHVDTTATWTVPLGPLGDKAELGRRVRAVGPGGGGIYVDRALETAYAALDREQVEQKHVLLFADGDDAEERRRAPALAQAARRKNVTTSVVALGRGQDTAGLEALSREGEGRFYLVEDATRLPAVFAEETTIAAGSALSEEPFRARPGMPIAATRNVDALRAPPLGGYVVTTRKPRAEVALLARDDDPLLAVWPAGSGHAGAFTSDYSEPWGTAWRDWPDAARLFAQLGRSLARGTDDGSVTVAASATAGALRVVATAVAEDGGLDADRNLTTTVVGPDGFARSRTLEATSAGSYEALVPLAHTGTYVADVRDEGSGRSVGSAAAVLTAGDELEPGGTDRALLQRIATLTGGRMRATLDDVFADRPQSRRNFRPLSTWLSAIGALAMLLSVAARRMKSLGVRRRLASAALRPESAPAPTSTADAPEAAATTPHAPEPLGPSAVTADTAEPPAPPTTAELLLSRRRRRQ